MSQILLIDRAAGCVGARAEQGGNEKAREATTSRAFGIAAMSSKSVRDRNERSATVGARGLPGLDTTDADGQMPSIHHTPYIPNCPAYVKQVIVAARKILHASVGATRGAGRVRCVHRSSWFRKEEDQA